jgi:hypothetical protein
MKLTIFILFIVFAVLLSNVPDVSADLMQEIRDIDVFKLRFVLFIRVYLMDKSS